VAVSIIVGNESFEIGHWTLLNSFFDTIRYHVSELDSIQYKALLVDLYKGHLRHQDAVGVVEDLVAIKSAFKSLEANQVIWDIRDLDKKPPWGNHISPHIKCLANYFVTSDGKDLFDLLIYVLQISSEKRLDVFIR
jgi:hypothetical protein